MEDLLPKQSSVWQHGLGLAHVSPAQRLTAQSLAHGGCQEKRPEKQADPTQATVPQAVSGGLTCMPRQMVLSMMRANIRYSK